MNLLKNSFYHILININPKLTFFPSIISLIDMTLILSTPEMREN